MRIRRRTSRRPPSRGGGRNTRRLRASIHTLPPELKDIIQEYVIFKPTSNDQLKKAVNLFCKHPNRARRKYGDISLWDTSLITDMACLFQNFNVDTTTFNADISRWNVSNVTNMHAMFMVPSLSINP
jgi:surface protein